MSSRGARTSGKIPLTLQARILCGGVRYQLSWLVLGLGTVFFFVFAFDSTSFFYFRGETETTKGTVIDVKSTVFATGSFAELKGGRGKALFRYSYEYHAAGSSYKGESLALAGKANVGDVVTVEYPHHNPAVSRIKATAPELSIPATLPLVLIMVIILVSLFTVISMSRKRIRGYRLLKGGVATTGKAVSKKLLSKSRGAEWWEVTFEFRDAHGVEHQIKDRPYVTERVETGDELQLLYDPHSPDKAFLVKNFSAPVQIEGNGGIKWGSRPLNLLSLLIPVLSIVFMLASIYFELSGLV